MGVTRRRVPAEFTAKVAFAALREKLARKDAIIAEILEGYVALKERLGRPEAMPRGAGGWLQNGITMSDGGEVRGLLIRTCGDGLLHIASIKKKEAERLHYAIEWLGPISGFSAADVRFGFWVEMIDTMRCGVSF